MEYHRFILLADYCCQKNLFPVSAIQTWWSVAEYKKEMWDDPTTTHLTEDMYWYLLKNKMICFGYTSQCKGYFQKYIKNGQQGIDKFLRHRIETNKNIKIAEYIKSFCINNEISPTAVVNGYITSNQLNGVALIAPTRIEQLKENMKWSDYELDKAVIKEIDCLKQSN